MYDAFDRVGLISCVLLIWAFFMVPAVGMGGTLLLEAEQFENHGGWVLDQQFMDQMGSPYLLAHGLGVPVADATTTVKFAEAGCYKVWVRTRDWVAPWGAASKPGRFEVVIGGRKLTKTFGTEGARWHWQEGGSVQITDLDVSVGLHDLTGFEGRCDAILFSSDFGFVPPNADPEMKVWRRSLLGLGEEVADGGRYDSELYEDQRRIDLVRAQKNISLFLRHRANEVETSGDEITAVIAQDTVSGRHFANMGSGILRAGSI